MFVLFVSLLFLGISWTTEGAFIFTKTPENTVYFMAGSNATFEWKYSVDNKATEFEYVLWKVVIGSNQPTLLYENATGAVIVGSGIPEAYVGRVEKIGQATLVVKTVNFNDSRSFQCVLLQKSGSQSSDYVQLTVTGKASVVPGITCHMAGSSVAFTCNATGVPSAYFTWWRNYGKSKQQLADDGENIGITSVTGSSTLVLKEVSVNDTGYYECNATAKPSQPNIGEGYLEVKKPEPTQEDEKASPERSFKVALGESKTLCCPIKGYPPSFVTWHKNGMPWSTSLDKCLTIALAKDEDFVNYTCSAADDSVGPYTFSLKEEPPVRVTAIESGKVRWSDVAGAQHYVVKITGNDIRDDVRFRVGKQPSMDLPFNALVLKEAEKNLAETNVCVKVVALSEGDDVIAKTPTCQPMTIKSGEVTLKPNIMFLLVLVYAGWKML